MSQRGVEPLRELAGHSDRRIALMNTNKWNEGPEGRMIPQGAANAQALRAILEEEGGPRHDADESRHVNVLSIVHGARTPAPSSSRTSSPATDT